MRKHVVGQAVRPSKSPLTLIAYAVKILIFLVIDDCWTDGRTHGRSDGLADGRADGRTDGRINTPMDGQTVL